jgi:hypothetical protein
MQSVIPGLTRNPVFSLVSRFRGDFVEGNDFTMGPFPLNQLSWDEIISNNSVRFSSSV